MIGEEHDRDCGSDSVGSLKLPNIAEAKPKPLLQAHNRPTTATAVDVNNKLPSQLLLDANNQRGSTHISGGQEFHLRQAGARGMGQVLDVLGDTILQLFEAFEDTREALDTPTDAMDVDHLSGSSESEGEDGGGRGEGKDGEDGPSPYAHGRRRKRSSEEVGSKAGEAWEKKSPHTPPRRKGRRTEDGRGGSHRRHSRAGHSR